MTNYIEPVTENSVPGANTLALGSGWNGWTGVDLSRRLRCDLGAVIRASLLASTTGSWRPIIFWQPSQNSNTLVPVYREPSMWSHPGGGIHSRELAIPFLPRGGIYYAGAYLSGFGDSPLTSVMIGRASIYGDPTGAATFVFNDGSNKVPALGVTYEPVPAVIDDDFTRSPVSWTATTEGTGASGLSGGAFWSIAPYWVDLNHSTGIGTLALPAQRQGLGQRLPSGAWMAPDLRNCAVKLRIKCSNWNSPYGRLRPMFQAQHPDYTNKYSPWVLDDVDLDACKDGNWHDFTFDLDPDGFTFLGGVTGGDYLEFDKTEALEAFARNFHLIEIRANGTSGPASGSRIDVADFRVVPTS